MTVLSQYVVKKVAVHSGGKHAMALTVDGKVFSWGKLVTVNNSLRPDNYGSIKNLLFQVKVTMASWDTVLVYLVTSHA